MTSNWKQFRVTREMLTAAARGKSAVEGGMMLSLEYRRAFFKICFCLLKKQILQSQYFPGLRLGSN